MTRLDRRSGEGRMWLCLILTAMLALAACSPNATDNNVGQSPGADPADSGAVPLASQEAE